MLFPAASVTVYVTVVVPIGYTPEAFEVPVKSFTTEATVQLSPVAGIAMVIFAVENPASVGTTMFVGQAMVGFSLSVTVTF